MSLKVGLISDIHATPAPLAEALEIFEREGVDTILCAGDVAGYGDDLEQTIALLSGSNAHVISGNHDLWWLSLRDYEVPGLIANYLNGLPAVVELSLEATDIYMVHASPPDSNMDGLRLLDEKGEVLAAERELWSSRLQGFAADVLVVGHTHQVFAEQLGELLVVNPGSTRFNHTCAILTLPEKEIRIITLSGKEAVMSWNWGMLYAS